MLVVPGVDPVSDVLSGLGTGDIPSVVDPFLLEGGEKRLGGGVVQGGAYSSHGLDDPQPRAGFGERFGVVLGAVVGVVDQSRLGSGPTTPSCHLERVADYLCSDMVGYRPSDHFSVPGVHDHRQIHYAPSGGCWVMSASHSLSGSVGENCRSTRSADTSPTRLLRR